MPFLSPFFGGGSLTKIDCSKKGVLILTSLLEDLAKYDHEFIDEPPAPPHVVGGHVSASK